MNLIWFRQDLRIHDHAALWHACSAGPTAAIVYLCPEQWTLHNDAPIKIDFYLRQLIQLQQQLSKLNIPLLIEHVPHWVQVPNHLLNLAKSHNFKHIYANIELGVNELNRDAKTQELLEKNSIHIDFYHDRTLFPVGSVLNKSNQPYQVFGAFKKYCYELLSISLPQCFPLPVAQDQQYLDKFSSTTVPSIHDFYSSADSHIKAKWDVGEDYALSLLDQFIEDHLYDYKNQRDFPDIEGTSQLSAFLNIGIISIRQCLQALFSEQNGHFHIDHVGQQTWLDELLWREFYQHILYHYPRLSKHQPFKTKTKSIPWRQSHNDFEAWKMGQTGIPIVDAGMRQMLQTGWMHNRVRMIVAMFLTKNLLIDWRHGEQWFMQHLIDGDLAANNGGWQWCASTGTDAVPYFRIFNPISQSIKFDAQGNYIRRWVSELAELDDKKIHDPAQFIDSLKLNYPKPIVDLKTSRVRAIEVFSQNL